MWNNCPSDILKLIQYNYEAINHKNKFKKSFNKLNHAEYYISNNVKHYIINNIQRDVDRFNMYMNIICCLCGDILQKNNKAKQICDKCSYIHYKLNPFHVH